MLMLLTVNLDMIERGLVPINNKMVATGGLYPMVCID